MPNPQQIEDQKSLAFGVLALPANKPSKEVRLLVAEAKDYLAERPSPFQQGQRVPRRESGARIRNYTGERLLREEPRRYRLIASMRQEGLGIRQTCRAAHCDPRTVDSVERHANQSVTTLKPKLIRDYGQLARMSVERLQEELPRMPINQVPVVAGIATDKFLTLIGDPNQRIELTVNDNRAQVSIFDRMNELASNMAKVIQAKVIEPEPLQLQDT